jgi:hypothetical protein
MRKGLPFRPAFSFQAMPELRGAASLHIVWDDLGRDVTRGVIFLLPENNNENANVTLATPIWRHRFGEIQFGQGARQSRITTDASDITGLSTTNLGLLRNNFPPAKQPKPDTIQQGHEVARRKKLCSFFVLLRVLRGRFFRILDFNLGMRS